MSRYRIFQGNCTLGSRSCVSIVTLGNSIRRAPKTSENIKILEENPGISRQRNNNNMEMIQMSISTEKLGLILQRISRRKRVSGLCQLQSSYYKGIFLHFSIKKMNRKENINKQISNCVLYCI